jgi:hypothetical protein
MFVGSYSTREVQGHDMQTFKKKPFTLHHCWNVIEHDPEDKYEDNNGKINKGKQD